MVGKSWRKECGRMGGLKSAIRLYTIPLIDIVIVVVVIVFLRIILVTNSRTESCRLIMAKICSIVSKSNWTDTHSMMLSYSLKTSLNVMWMRTL